MIIRGLLEVYTIITLSYDKHIKNNRLKLKKTYVSDTLMFSANKANNMYLKL